MSTTVNRLPWPESDIETANPTPIPTDPRLLAALETSTPGLDAAPQQTDRVETV